MLNHERQDKIDARVEWLTAMSRRRVEALANNDLTELDAIAQAYEERGMVATAKEIRIAISLRKQVK